MAPRPYTWDSEPLVDQSLGHKRTCSDSTSTVLPVTGLTTFQSYCPFVFWLLVLPLSVSPTSIMFPLKPLVRWLGYSSAHKFLQKTGRDSVRRKFYNCYGDKESKVLRTRSVDCKVSRTQNVNYTYKLSLCKKKRKGGFSTIIERRHRISYRRISDLLCHSHYMLLCTKTYTTNSM